MALWKIEPVARPDDPRWQDYRRWREIVVRADSAALAVVQAARELGTPEPQIGNESPAGRTGLEDVKLYRVRPVSDDDLVPGVTREGPSPRVLLAVPDDGPLPVAGSSRPPAGP
jgi:hypothetical protein